jgi:thioredoxin 1
METFRIVMGAAIGAAVGGTIGYITRCSGGGCPLMGNPIGGVLIGAVMGILAVTSFMPEPNVETLTSQHFKDIGTAEEFGRLVQENNVVLVDFYADWCRPCRGLKPTILRLADRYAGRVKVAGVNVDKLGALARQYGVSSIPDVRIFQGGQPLRRFVGSQSESSYAGALDEALAGTAAPQTGT